MFAYLLTICTVGVQRISFASNNIKSLPEEIGACQSLEELYLSNNAKLSSLPSSAGHLRCLCLYCRTQISNLGLNMRYSVGNIAV